MTRCASFGARNLHPRVASSAANKPLRWEAFLATLSSTRDQRHGNCESVRNVLKETSIVKKQDFVHILDLTLGKTMPCDCYGKAAACLLEAFSSQLKYILAVLGEIAMHELGFRGRSVRCQHLPAQGLYE